MKYRWSYASLTPALQSLEISALTLSIRTSCVNTNTVSVKTFPEKKDQLSSGTAIILFTMHAHDGVTSTFLTVFAQRQAGGEWGHIGAIARKQAKAVAMDAFRIAKIIFQTLSWSNTASAHNQMREQEHN